MDAAPTGLKKDKLTSKKKSENIVIRSFPLLPFWLNKFIDVPNGEINFKFISDTYV